MSTTEYTSESSMKSALSELHCKILSELALMELSTSDLISRVHANRTRVFDTLKELLKLGLAQAWTGPHNRKTWFLTPKGRRSAESLPAEYSQNVQFTVLGFDLGSPGKAKLTLRLPSDFSVVARQHVIDSIAPVIQKLGAALTYGYLDVTGWHESTALNASISLHVEPSSIAPELARLRKSLERIVERANERFREWRTEYERLYRSFNNQGSGDVRTLVACKRMLHQYFAAESVFVEDELRNFGIETDLLSYAAIKSPVLPRLQPFEVSISPAVELISPPKEIRFGKFWINDRVVDLATRGFVADFLQLIRMEPIWSWIERNRKMSASDLWFFPIPWSEMGVPHTGGKHIGFFDERLALEGLYGGLFYVKKQKPRVNWFIRYVLHKISRSSIKEGVEHWFAFLENEMRRDEEIRTSIGGLHEIDDITIIETYIHVKQELWSSELPSDLARVPARFDPKRPPYLRIIYDPIDAGEKLTNEQYVMEKSAVKKFLGIVQRVRRSRRFGSASASYRVARAMLEVKEEYEQRRSGGWSPAMALDDAVSVVMTKHRDEW